MLKDKMKQAVIRDRREICFHEAGHAAMIYWRRESLFNRQIVIHTDRYGGSVVTPMVDLNEGDLMVLIGGPMAELLSMGIVAKIAIRFPREYQDPNSDSTRMRALVRRLRGKDDRSYQFAVQERVREIIQRPDMWAAITVVAERLYSDGQIGGEEVEEVFNSFGVQDQFGKRE